MTTEPTNHDEEIKKPTFFSLLTDLEKADQGLEKFAGTEDEILALLERKVDALKYIELKFKSRIAEVDADIKELTAIKKSLVNAKENFLAQILRSMNIRNVTKQPGIKWRVSKTTSERTTVLKEPDAKTFLAFQDLINREYVWDKIKARAAYEKDPKSLENYIRIDTTESVKFTLIKGLDE